MKLVLQLSENYNTEIVLFSIQLANAHNLSLHIISDLDVYDLPSCGIDATFYSFKSIYEFLATHGNDDVAGVIHPISNGQMFSKKAFSNIKNWYEY